MQQPLTFPSLPPSPPSLPPSLLQGATCSVGLRGPGESQLESDKREIRRKIRDLKKELLQLHRHRSLHRVRREKMVRDSSYIHVYFPSFTNYFLPSSLPPSLPPFLLLNQRLILRSLPPSLPPSLPLFLRAILWSPSSGTPTVASPPS